MNDDFKEELKDAYATIERLRNALEPFGYYAGIMVPQIDFSCGNGFYAALQKARTVLEETRD